MRAQGRCVVIAPAPATWALCPCCVLDSDVEKIQVTITRRDCGEPVTYTEDVTIDDLVTLAADLIRARIDPTQAQIDSARELVEKRDAGGAS